MFLYGGQTLSVACGDIFPRPGEVFRRASPWQRGRTNPFRHFALRNATSPEGGALGKEGEFRPHSSTARRSQPISGKPYVPAKASPFRERWHGEAGPERVASRKNPLSRLRRQLSRRESPWQNQQVSSSFVNGRRSQPLSCKLSALAKASPFRERWHGEAVTERVSPRLAAAVGKKRLSRHAKNPWTIVQGFLWWTV